MATVKKRAHPRMRSKLSYPSYPARLSGGGRDVFVVTFEDVPEAITGAATAGASWALASDALSVALEAYLDDGRPLPRPRRPKMGERAVPVSRELAGRVRIALGRH